MFEEKYRNNIIDFMFNKYEVEGMKKTVVPDDDELDEAGYEKLWVTFEKEAWALPLKKIICSTNNFLFVRQKIFKKKTWQFQKSVL